MNQIEIKKVEWPEPSWRTAAPEAVGWSPPGLRGCRRDRR